MAKKKGKAVAKPKKASKPKPFGGPYLSAAVFCEEIIEAKDNTLSPMRIVDNFKLTISPEAPPDIPSKSNPLLVNQKALISFKTGDSPGEHEVSFVLEEPDGARHDAHKRTLNLNAQPHGGASVRMVLGIPVYRTGLYWLDVFLDGQLATRMPFNVEIERLAKAAAKDKSPENAKSAN